MATDKAVKFATDLIAQTGDAGMALAQNATGGVPTTDDHTKVVGTLIDNLLALVKTQKAEAMALVPPAPEGEGVLTGTVVSIKEKYGTYGAYNGVVIETEVGNKAWFIEPKGATFVVGQEVA